MRKIETIWHEILFQALEKKKFKFTQQELAEKFGYSLSTVNYALDVPAEMGMVRKESKFSVLTDFNKLLYYWASERRLAKDIIYKTYADQDIISLEKIIPPEAIFGGYTAAKEYLGEPPADYSKIYFYADESSLEEIKRRYPENNQRPNVFVLKKIPALERYGDYTTLPQTFVDIWNLRDWYAREFVISLEDKINALLSQSGY